ncbi:MAG: MBOAT family O-acyltransferase [Myxococcaceae bacterium]
MLFSSNIFLFLFMPIYVFGYHALDLLGALVLRRKELSQQFSNGVLFALSLFFYFWGSGRFIVVFAVAIAANTLLGWLIEKSTTRKRSWLVLGVIGNLSILLYFKYFGFLFAQVAAALLSAAGVHLEPLAPIYLPVGVSFYTFMAISYLVEVYQGQVKGAGLLRFGTYLTLFPHLVAGPIVRYSEIAGELRERKVTVPLAFEGVRRFSVGLAKKVILANSLGAVADAIFALPTSELTTSLSWIGVASYTLQIYFDFSGYTDMAIGLARFFGFHFPENFNAPYLADSVTDFWRRWHMSLSRWFRDYLYIALGGNRAGPLRTYFNLFTVFALCGLWHGASWTFVIWGIFHGVLLVAERVLRLRFGVQPRGIPGRVLTMVLVMVGWVFFRAPTLGGALAFLKAMFGFAHVSGWQYFSARHYLDAATTTYLLAGAAIVLIPWHRVSWKRFETRGPRSFVLAQGAAIVVLTLLSLTVLSKTQFNPFIYFQF